MQYANLRVRGAALERLRSLATAEKRTMRAMFEITLDHYYATNPGTAETAPGMESNENAQR